MPKPEKKGVEHNHYLDQITQNHLVIREKIQDFNKKLPNYRDTASFFEDLYPMMLEIDQIMATAGAADLSTRADTLADASSNRLFTDYNRLFNEHYIALFSIYHQAGDSLNSEERHKADSIWQLVNEIDQGSLNVFLKFNQLDSATSIQFTPLYP